MKVSKKALARLLKEDGRRWQEAHGLIEEAMEFKPDWEQVTLYREPKTGITGISYGDVAEDSHILTIFRGE
jgi:hypothetical protein